MLFIEYDVAADGVMEVVGLVNAVERDDDDPEGEAWSAWRRSEFDDGGLGCAAVAPADLVRMESALDAEALRVVVEEILLADRAAKQNAR
jgi:hypothetical protein